jgi:hypothetical protein
MHKLGPHRQAYIDKQTISIVAKFCGQWWRGGSFHSSETAA